MRAGARQAPERRRDDVAMTRKMRTLVLAALAGLMVAGCVSSPSDNRGNQPIPPKLVASMNAKGMTPADPVFVRIYKQESELEVWKRDTSGRYALLKTYPICRWSGQLGPKKQAGDRQAPEGFYTVTGRQLNPRSQFYLSFNLGYPNKLEAAKGYTGEALMVHGACSSSGCYAMTDQQAAELYAIAREAFVGGQRDFLVEALPFRMTQANLARHRGDPNMPFWMNLAEGVAVFDATRQPPRVDACGDRYVFNAVPTQPGATFEPLAPCPAYTTDPATAAAIAGVHQKAQLIATDASPAPLPVAYQDGGMHESFRRLMQQVGSKKMATLTSVSGDVPVSRPQAALADPYSQEAGLAAAPPAAGPVPAAPLLPPPDGTAAPVAVAP